VLLGDRRVELREYPDPSPGAGEVLVQIARASVCGTDIHKYLLPPSEIPRLGDEAMIIGHEPAGYVGAVGSGVTAFAPGDRVMLAGVVGCAECPACLEGFNTACWKGPTGLAWGRHGATATHIVWPARYVLALPSALSFDAATVLTCAGGTAYTIVRETRLSSEDRLAIVGLGPVGLSLVILAKAMGASVVGVDLDTRRLEQASALGADSVVDASSQDAIAAVRAFSRGRGCDVTADCAGQPRARSSAIEMAATRGRVALAGLGVGAVGIDVDRAFIGRQLTVMGIAATPLAYFPSLLGWATEKSLPFESMITHHFPLDRASEAFELMAAGKSGKVIVDVTDLAHP
jgi:(R,R)-butanediol dehydrogenase / meso-butanediol dehydrogenase / diacetyl reductase